MSRDKINAVLKLLVVKSYGAPTLTLNCKRVYGVTVTSDDVTKLMSEGFIEPACDGSPWLKVTRMGHAYLNVQ